MKTVTITQDEYDTLNEIAQQSRYLIASLEGYAELHEKAFFESSPDKLVSPLEAFQPMNCRYAQTSIKDARKALDVLAFLNKEKTTN